MTWDPSLLPRGRGKVALKRDGDLAILELNNPEARNAMSVAMMADFLKLVEDLVEVPPLVLILCGAGDGGFCAGGDLRDVRASLLNERTAVEMPRVMGAALSALSSLPTVVISAVDGHALGGGAELSQAADWVILGPGAGIGFVHARLGVSPGWGGASLLLRRVGRRRSLHALLAAKTFRGAEAQRLGIADEVLDSGSALSRAHELAGEILRLPDAAIRGILEIVRSSDPRETEADVFARLWAGPAHRDALQTAGAGR